MRERSGLISIHKFTKQRIEYFVRKLAATINYIINNYTALAVGSNTITSAGWYRFAESESESASGTFTIAEQTPSSGSVTDSVSIQFTLAANGGYTSEKSPILSALSLVGTNRYLTKIRILTKTGSDPYVEAYFDTGVNTEVKIDIHNTTHGKGWTPIDLEAGSIPSGYSSYEWTLSTADIPDPTAKNIPNLGSEIKTAYEAEPNAYTDTKDTKLSGIAEGAEVNPSDADIVDSVNNEGGLGSLDGDADDIAESDDRKWAGESNADVTSTYLAANDYRKIFLQSAAPTAESNGDLWIDTDNDIMKYWDGEAWTDVKIS